MSGRANYSATKAYLTALSKALQQEARGTGVRVQALCPGFTYTEFHDTEELKDFDRSYVPRFLWMTAETVVEASLNGLAKGKAVVIPGFWNRLIATAAQSLVGSALMKAAGRVRDRRRMKRPQG